MRARYALLAPLLLLLSVQALIGHAQEEPYVYTGVVYVVGDGRQPNVLIAESPITITYMPDRGLINVNHAFTHPALAGALRDIVAIPFQAQGSGVEAKVDIVYMAAGAGSLYLCTSALAVDIPGGTAYVDPGTGVLLAAEYRVGVQGGVMEVAFQLSAAPEPFCGVQITSPEKLAVIGLLSIAILAGSVYTFFRWRGTLEPLWGPVGL